MPIYAYKCNSCGHAKDVLQKMSADPLTVCPACGAATFTKQLTAAGFQLKGSGWYVTDFRGGNNNAAPAGESAASGESTASGKGDAAAAPAAVSAAVPASTPAPAAAPSSSSTSSPGSSSAS